jgi:hypothetical protein
MRSQIWIHPNVVAGPKGPSTRQTSNQKLQAIHLRQSHLDEACGAHCVCMALIGLRIVKRKALEDSPPSRMTRPMSAMWRKASVGWFGGLSVGGLVNVLKPFANRVSIKISRATDRKLLQFVVDQLAKERFVIVGIQNAKAGVYHWVLAVGYGVKRERALFQPERIYILDPNRTVWPMSQWNGELSIEPFRKRARARIWRDSEGVELPVTLDGAVAIGNV